MDFFATPTRAEYVFEFFRKFSQAAFAIGLLGAPVSAQTTNSEESAAYYGETRGWTIYSMGDGRGLFSCRAVRGHGYNDQIMIEYDGFPEEWRVMVQGKRPAGDGPGTIGTGVYYDGEYMDRQVYFGHANQDGSSNSHAKLDLTEWEFGRLREGNQFRIDLVGQGSRTWSLTGTTAATQKIGECLTSMLATPMPRSLPAAAPAPQPRQVPNNHNASIDGFSVGYVRFPAGQFRSTGGGNWVEEGDNGSVSYFTEIERHIDGVALNDRSRNLQVVIELNRNAISWTTNFDLNALQHLYNIDCYDRQASAVC